MSRIKKSPPTRGQLNRLMREYHKSPTYTGASSVLPETILTLLPSIPEAQQQKDPTIWLRLFHYPSDSDWLVAGASRLDNGDTALWLHALIAGNVEASEWGCDGLAWLSGGKQTHIEYDMTFTPKPFSKASRKYRQPRVEWSPPQAEPTRRERAPKKSDLIIIPVMTIRL